MKTVVQVLRETPLLHLSLGPFHGAIAVPSVTRCRRRRHRSGHRFAARAWHVIGPHDMYSALGMHSSIESLYTCVGYVVQFLPRDSYAKRGSGVDSSDTC